MVHIIDASSASDLELLMIEIETLWATDDRRRTSGADLVIASTSAGAAPVFGTAVPEDVAATLRRAVTEATPPTDLSSPPAFVQQCQRVLEASLGTMELRANSGPSYFIGPTVAFPASVTLVRSGEQHTIPGQDANPGNWEADEWQQLLEGQLGPWVMAIRDGQVIAICHTPVSTPRGAEAGVWTRPGSRGQGHAAAVTAAWAALMRPTGRYLFYSTSRTNISSQRVAARLALRPIGWLWQLARLRPIGRPQSSRQPV